MDLQQALMSSREVTVIQIYKEWKELVIFNKSLIGYNKSSLLIYWS